MKGNKSDDLRCISPFMLVAGIVSHILNVFSLSNDVMAKINPFDHYHKSIE